MAELRMFVNGQAMSGGSISHALAGAQFLGPRRTAPKYHFFSVRDEFPGLHLAGTGGVSIPGELYAVTYEILRDNLLPSEPKELELGAIEMEDGSGSLSMRMRPEWLESSDLHDISDQGGWRAYLAAKEPR